MKRDMIEKLKKCKSRIENGEELDELLAQIDVLQEEISALSKQDLQQIATLIAQMIELLEHEKSEIVKNIAQKEKREQTLSSYSKTLKY